ncbi:MAG: flavodoxin family protein [Oscillospiraceae bacterium]|nr:flavodoxin family protein [Oscillospiraceae bacterium]
MNALILNCSPVRDGATAEIVRTVSEAAALRFQTKTVCIGDYDFRFCKGCRRCHETAECVMQPDGADLLMDEFAHADVIVCVSPSYWADIPGQFKAFIDRCTPWCNTHEPHKALPAGKKGYVIALRTGLNRSECERIIGSIEHFYGHLEIECCGSLSLTGIEYREAVSGRMDEIRAFCSKINGSDTDER